MAEGLRFDQGGVGYRCLVWTPGALTSGTARLSPLVLLHGFAQSAHAWDQVAPRLARNRTVYALDLVGHGESDRPDDAAAYALEAQGEALLAFLAFAAADSPCASDAVPGCDGSSGRDGRPERDVPDVPAAGMPRICEGREAQAAKPVVVGYSMGGRVALAAACRSPQAFGGLVLESAGVGPADEAERSAAAERDARNAAALRQDGLQAFMDAWERLPLFATQRDLPAATRDRVRAERLANDAEALARSFEGAGQHAMPPREAVIGCLRTLADGGVPVAYVAGSLDGKYRALARLLHDGGACAAHIVEGAGHNVHLEAPDAFVRVLRGFPG